MAFTTKILAISAFVGTEQSNGVIGRPDTVVFAGRCTEKLGARIAKRPSASLMPNGLAYSRGPPEILFGSHGIRRRRARNAATGRTNRSYFYRSFYQRNTSIFREDERPSRANGTALIASSSPS